MDLSALPYLIYFIIDLFAIAAFVVIQRQNIVQRQEKRLLLTWVLRWLTAMTIRYGLIVLSAGASPAIPRDAVIWWIRAMVFVEEFLFAASAVAFVGENVHWD